MYAYFYYIAFPEKNLVFKPPTYVYFFREWFGDVNTGFKKMGSRIIPTKLCQTLRIIAKNGGYDLYNGTLSKLFLEDIKEAGGIITAEDMNKYQ